MKSALGVAAAVLAVALAGCMDGPAVHAQAELKRTTATGVHIAVSGWANFTQRGDAVTVDVVVTGLTPSATHGTHIHEGTSCGPTTSGNAATPAGAAGGHYNPDNRTHPDHRGDLGNLVVDASGVGRLTVTRNVFSVRDGAEFGVLGRAVIIHAMGDDGSPPAGNAGGRSYCGLIAAG